MTDCNAVTTTMDADFGAGNTMNGTTDYGAVKTTCYMTDPCARPLCGYDVTFR